MIKRCFLLLVVLINQINVYGFDDNDNLNRDSLLMIWENNSNSDTARVNALSEFIWAIYLYDFPDSAMKLAKVQYDFAERNQLDQWKASALLIMGRVLDRKGIYTKAIKKYQEAVSYYKESNDIVNLGSFYNDMAIIHISMEEYEEAQNYFDKIINIATQTGDTSELDVYYNNLAILFRLKKDYDLALSYYDKSLKMKIQRNDQLGIALVYNNLGTIYLELKDYDLAYNNLIKSYNLRLMIGDKSRIVTSANNLCEYFLTIKDFQNAKSYGLKAIEMSQELQLKDEMKTAYKQLYSLFKLTKRHKDALYMYEKYHILNDSILSEEYQNSLLKLKIKEKYEFMYLMDSINNTHQIELKNINSEYSKKINTYNFIMFFLISIVIIILIIFLLIKGRAK